MDTKAWFGKYLKEHQPDGSWSLQADWAVRACIRLYQQTEDEAYSAYVIAWADSLVAADGCRPECGKALFFALERTGEEKYRDAIGQVMAQLGRSPGAAALPAETLYAELPFRMAYEMKLGGMEKVGLCAGKLCQSFRALWDEKSGLVSGGRYQSAIALLALADCIDLCADQLYEHWRAMVDVYRVVLRGLLAAEAPENPETAGMVLTALYAGVRMRIIDPERYLPIAAKRISALRAAGFSHAADMLEAEGGAL